MKKIVFVIALTPMLSCSTSKNAISNISKNSFEIVLTGISTDESYGYSPKNPIQVGGASQQSGPLNERKFLNSLAGPNGEKVSYVRAGSCCPIKSKNDPMGFGQVLLDDYRVTWEGSKDTVSIYINMYDHGVLNAPKGFTIKK